MVVSLSLKLGDKEDGEGEVLLDLENVSGDAGESARDDNGDKEEEVVLLQLGVGEGAGDESGLSSDPEGVLSDIKGTLGIPDVTGTGLTGGGP
jgi:hypothetical protein